MAGTTQLMANVEVVTTEKPLPVIIGTAGTAGAPTSTKVTAIQGFGYSGSSTVTRAANQTVYTANDVVGGALTIANVGPAAGEITITRVICTLNITALPAAMTTFALYLYNVTPPSAIADNSPFTYGSGDRASYLGRITGLTAVLIGTTTSSVTFELEGIVKPVTTASTSLFAYLVTDGGFTPAANSETYTLTVKAQGA